MGRCRSDKLVHSRVLAVLTVLLSGYTMVTVIVRGEATWAIVLRVTLFALLVIAGICDFSAIGFNIPLLMIPIILVSILTTLINAAFCVLSLTVLVDDNSFYAEYLKNHRSSKGGSESDAKSFLKSYAINIAIVSAIMVLLGARSIFVHRTAYRLIGERRRRPTICQSPIVI